MVESDRSIQVVIHGTPWRHRTCQELAVESNAIAQHPLSTTYVSRPPESKPCFSITVFNELGVKCSVDAEPVKRTSVLLFLSNVS